MVYASIHVLSILLLVNHSLGFLFVNANSIPRLRSRWHREVLKSAFLSIKHWRIISLIACPCYSLCCCIWLAAQWEHSAQNCHAVFPPPIQGVNEWNTPVTFPFRVTMTDFRDVSLIQTQVYAFLCLLCTVKVPHPPQLLWLWQLIASSWHTAGDEWSDSCLCIVKYNGKISTPIGKRVHIVVTTPTL